MKSNVPTVQKPLRNTEKDRQMMVETIIVCEYSSQQDCIDNKL